jgi:hypothetical protein
MPKLFWDVCQKEIAVLYRQAVRLLRHVNADEERVILTFDRAARPTHLSLAAEIAKRCHLFAVSSSHAGRTSINIVKFITDRRIAISGTV